MRVPDWWQAALLALASFRTFRLLAKDVILDGPRSWLLRLPRNWEEGRPIPSSYRDKLAEFLLCPWCLGAWATLAWWATWQLWPHGMLVAATPLALSAAVGLISNLDQDD